LPANAHPGIHIVSVSHTDTPSRSPGMNYVTRNRVAESSATLDATTSPSAPVKSPSADTAPDLKQHSKFLSNASDYGIGKPLLANMECSVRHLEYPVSDHGSHNLTHQGSL